MTDPQRSAVRWLKVSYIVGALADGVVAVLMLLPDRMGETEFRVPMGLGASLMFGWTALLLWAAASGYFTVGRVLPSVTLLIALIVLFGFSYWKASRVTG